ncbi:MAG: HAMP domain-containing protein [Ignavibacteriae bacterium]|nr:HAMP domain-containing protein [Ignavibacteriota bacterium]
MIKSIRAKIVWTFAILVGLNLAAGFWAIYNFYALGTTVATILRENYQSVLAAENMVKSLERQDNALLDASQGEEPTIGGGFTENKELFFYWYEQAFGPATMPQQSTLRDSIQLVYRHYTSVADSMKERIAQGAFLHAKNYYFEMIRPVSDRLRELCFNLFELNQAAMYNAEARTHSIANQTAYGTMMASIITLILSIIATAWLTKVLIKPAEALTERVKQIGMGQLDLKIDVLSNDEIGHLSREFNKMTERLRQFEQMNIDKIISEKRKSEAIVESISDGIIVTDAQMRVLHINNVMADLFGHDAQSAVDAPVSSIIRDERIMSLIRGASTQDGRGGTPREDATTEKVNYLQFEREDKHHYFRPKVTRIFDTEGHLYGVLTLLQDVTQFKELDRMKSDFIATLSHEFRTPLTSINMSIDILNQEILGALNPRQKELIDSTREDCYRLTKLARELLQLSKLESGRLQFKDEELNVRSVIEFSLKPLQLQFQEKSIRLETDIASDIPTLIADEQQVSWVINNLVTNALKYTSQGGRVTVRAREQPDGILIEVEDTGHGIAAEDIKNIFDKFVQVKRTADATPGSVGLGLAIAKEIVETYGGRIWVASEPGKGSTFSFIIPPNKVHSTTNNI